MEADELKDIQGLITIFFPFAEEMVAKFGKFVPFAGATTTAGEYVSVGNMQNTNTPGHSGIITDLKQSLRYGAGKFLAVALFYEAKIKNEETGTASDAIAVFVEHKNGQEAYEFFYPYSLGENDQFVVNDSFGNTVAKEIF
jgi:hypothetical protein